MLKLDDLIQEETAIEFNGKSYKFNTSLKSMIKFQKWSEKLNDESFLNNEKNIEELISIMILDSKSFLEDFFKLNLKSQTLCLNALIENWVKEMIPDSNIQKNNVSKKNTSH